MAARRFYYIINLVPTTFDDTWRTDQAVGPGYRSLNALLDNYRRALGEPIRLRPDDDPEGVDNILGRIHYEPEQVYYIRRDDGTIFYFGVTQFNRRRRQ